MKKAALISSLLIAMAATSASAADYSSGYYSDGGMSFISELRMGVMSHDVDRREKDSVDLQAELLFQPIGGLGENPTLIDRFLAPRPHIGASINTDSNTSYGYAGVSWLFPVYGPFFVEASFGGMVHDGKLGNTDPNQEPLGTRALFHESASLGVDYDRFRFMITVEHSSNAGLGSWNHGLTNVGGRVGYKF